MPVVNEDLDLPGGGDPGAVQVEVALSTVDGSGAVGYKGTKTFVKPAIPPATLGAWTLTLDDNASISPTGTVYTRTVLQNSYILARDRFIVPVGGGPYNIKDLLIDSLDPLPDPVPTNLLDSAEITVATSDLAVNAFAPVLVPGLSIDVPDIAESVLIRASGPLLCNPSRTNSITTTSGSPAITAASGLVIDDTGRNITGTGIAADTRVLSVQSATAATLSKNATSSATNTLTISGGSSAAAICIFPDATPALGEFLDIGWVQLISGVSVARSVAEYIVPPHTPGDYYVGLYSLNTGTARIDANAGQVGRIMALRLGAA